jgi:predicted GIY-YIG superfamily endonuclease
MTTTVYVLSLEGGRYYVGKTVNLIKRYQEHLNGKGASWTNKYPPISLVSSIEGASPFDEDMVVKQYMAKYGIEKVRGGSYVKDVLAESEKHAIQKEIWSAQDCCTGCGSTTHWIGNCDHNKSERNKANKCDRCGRPGHCSDMCYAHTDIDGNALEIDADEDDDDDDDDEDEDDDDDDDEDDDDEDDDDNEDY